VIIKSAVDFSTSLLLMKARTPLLMTIKYFITFKIHWAEVQLRLCVQENRVKFRVVSVAHKIIFRFVIKLTPT